MNQSEITELKQTINEKVQTYYFQPELIPEMEELAYKMIMKYFPDNNLAQMKLLIPAATYMAMMEYVANQEGYTIKSLRSVGFKGRAARMGRLDPAQEMATMKIIVMHKLRENGELKKI